MQVRFEFDDLQGHALTSPIQVGDSFLLSAFVSDIRATPTGISQAFLNVNLPTSLVSIGGAVTHGADLNASPFDSMATGNVDAGGIDTDGVAPITPGAEELLFSVPLHADAQGTLDVTAGLDADPGRQIIFFGETSPTDLSAISFAGGSTTIAAAAGPVVSSITPVGSSPTNAASVHFTVTFSEDVTGVDATDFAPVTTGSLSGASITNVSGSGSSYDVTVSTGTGNGTLALELVDDDSIQDAANLPLGGEGTGDGDFVSPTAYMVDKAVPSVAVTPVAINAANEHALTVSGTGEDGAHIGLTLADAGNAHVIGPLTTTVSGGVWSITGIDAGALAEGTISYMVTATDAANNIGTDTENATKDTVSPAVAVTSVTNPVPDSTPAMVVAGTTEIDASVVVKISDAGGAHVIDSIPATVNTDGTWSTATVDVSSLNDGVLTITVTASDAADNSSIASATTVKGNYSLTAQDVTNANSASLTPYPFSVTYSAALFAALGGTSPSLTVQPPSGAAVTTQTVGSPVTGTDGSVTVDYQITPPGGNWNLAPAGTYTIRLVEGDATATLGTFNDAVVQPPTIALPTSINSDNQNNVAVSGTGEAATTVSVVASDGTHQTDAQTATVGNDGNWTITGGIDVHMLNEGTITFTVTGSGNQTASHTVSKDTLAPTVVSIVPVESSPASAKTLHFTVTFSESVTGVDASDFTLVTTGSVTPTSITSVTGSGTTYTITVSAPSGDGTLGVNLVDDDTILDQAGNPLGGVGTGNANFTGTTIALDR
ncbi:MAG TPA: Ig-like domain-containing protein, partial [Pirellulales bacterium]|nr:Ig-like domain-containing protein [Pirellulales bacterium]